MLRFIQITHSAPISQMEKRGRIEDTLCLSKSDEITYYPKTMCLGPGLRLQIFVVMQPGQEGHHPDGCPFLGPPSLPVN